MCLQILYQIFFRQYLENLKQSEFVPVDITHRNKTLNCVIINLYLLLPHHLKHLKEK
jgi:hypothetical protein